MMGGGLRLVLLLFALVGFGGAGAALAVARLRRMAEGEDDLGMIGVAAMLGVFGVLCTIVGGGLSGVLAFGGVAVFASYVLTAQQVGLFRVDAIGAAHPVDEPAGEPRRAS